MGRPKLKIGMRDIVAQRGDYIVHEGPRGNLEIRNCNWCCGPALPFRAAVLRDDLLIRRSTPPVASICSPSLLLLVSSGCVGAAKLGSELMYTIHFCIAYQHSVFSGVLYAIYVFLRHLVS